MIKYSIIIPTCNKNLTEICLQYISHLIKPKDDYEVLVVHNVTKDDIKAVINDYSNKIPNLKYFYEETYGQMSSRHRGAKEAQGEILCYLDDDSFVDKNWLIAIEKTFNNPDAVLAGGNNLPLYESKPPKWLKHFWINEIYGKWLGQLSLINFQKRKMLLPAWFAFGCNFIIKKDIFFNMGGTNPDVVPKEKQRFQGDGETVLSLKLNQNGYVLHFNPKIRIHHFVPKERMTLEYFQKRAFYQGVCDSFSKIRKDNGFSYYDFISNKNVENFNTPSLFKKLFHKILNTNINDKNFSRYLSIKTEYEKSYKEGFDFHQNEVKNDPELLKWVLKENYLDWYGNNNLY
jgi:cellulose synthase/poly-beta-1,6-N-acetylglucosamine synthase-like glycosyltransferase